MNASISVRMYNQNNLGDCFLLKIKEGKFSKYILIDFGSYTSNDEREIEIAQNIRDTVKDKPLTIVLTHQHKDHLSGFISSKEIFNKLTIDEVWLSFLDDYTDGDAINIKTRTEKFWNINKKNKEKIKGTIKKKSKEIIKERSNEVNFDEKQIEAILDFIATLKGVDEQQINTPSLKGFNEKEIDVVKAVLKELGEKKIDAIITMLNAKDGIDIFGEELYAENQSGGQAISNLKKWSKNNIRFLNPGDIINLNNIKTYVLGPPKKIENLQKLDPSRTEAVHSLNTLTQLHNLEISSNLLNEALYKKRSNFPFQDNLSIPIDDIDNDSPSLKQKEVYENEDWRRIDYDWLNDFGRMSLHMDTLTNNTSLVLAFELPQSKKVLLFAGDAQIGNWQSWFEIAEFKDSEGKVDKSVKAKNLLARTVLYKAGHHSSHNATLSEGLNLMNEEELVIMIPVNGKVSDDNHFLMLKPGMLAGYNRKSKGRVLRSDTIFQKKIEMITENDFVDENSAFAKKFTTAKDKDGKHLYIEYKVS
jgi:ribonuclease BN (tRNA processing enzyme)